MCGRTNTYMPCLTKDEIAFIDLIVRAMEVKSEDGLELSTICRQFKMKAPDGKVKQKVGFGIIR